MKRFLSVLLAVLFVFSMLPVSAFAEGDGETCALTEGCTLPSGHDGACSVSAEEEPTEQPDAPTEPPIEQLDEGETVAVSSVTVAPHVSDAPLTLTVGQTLQLDAVVLPEDAPDRTVAWTSADEAVASVDASGLVTALAEGTCVIRATAGGVVGELTITVEAAEQAPAEEPLAFAFTVSN